MLRNYWSGQQVSLRTNASTQSAGRMPANRPQDAGAPTGGAPVDFESWWRKCLHDGFIPNTALPPKTVSLKSDWASSLSATNTQSPTPNTLEVVFRPDPSIYDGRFANNGW